MDFRVLRPGQRSQLWIGRIDEPTAELVLETDQILIEAPNWDLAGDALYVNGEGVLWRVDLDRSPELTRIEHDGLPPINNDHVLDPDGRHVYLSAMDRQIHRADLRGGTVTKVTDGDGWHFLHGVSPDGDRLAYVAISDFAQPGRLAVRAADGSTTVLDTGPGHLDGPEWSPDGSWILFNTETFSTEPGHAQLARIPDGGGPLDRLVTSDTVDWFPHLSPDGRWATYLAFPAGTLGHPADLDVTIHLVGTDDWATPVRSYPVFGGQGSLNVNSWSPDSTRFGFVTYPIA